MNRINRKNMANKKFIKSLLASAIIAAVCSQSLFASEPETLDTRVGKLSFTHDFANGYPTDKTRDLLLNEMDFQRATQAYIWAVPIVGFAQWEYANKVQTGATNGQIVYLNSYDDVREALTANITTPYMLSFTDLTEGPWVYEVPGPAGAIRGAVHSMWQIGQAQMTTPGKYLFVGPGEKIPPTAEVEGYKVVQTDTMNVMQVLRLMSEDPTERRAMLDKIKVYPYAERENPKPRGYIEPEPGAKYEVYQPRGLEYWKRLSDIINREPVHERDRFFMAMLKDVGIEKGKPFNPDARQAKILKEASLIGEAMTKTLDFDNPRLEDSHYMENSYWEFATTGVPSQRREHYDDLDGRASWLYEALTNDIKMHGQKTGQGQVYLTAYKDADGDWLNSAQDYTVHLPPNVPAAAFWSFTVYDVSTRSPSLNATEQVDRSSRMDLDINADGSIDLYVGPSKPIGDKAKNWIQTTPGKSWFPYFRLYSPTKAFMDRTWIIPDIQKAK